MSRCDTPNFEAAAAHPVDSERTAESSEANRTYVSSIRNALLLVPLYSAGIRLMINVRQSLFRTNVSETRARHGVPYYKLSRSPPSGCFYGNLRLVNGWRYFCPPSKALGFWFPSSLAQVVDCGRQPGELPLEDFVADSGPLLLLIGGAVKLK